MKPNQRAAIMILLCGIILFMPQSCKKDDTGEPEDQVKIPSTTKVITANDWNANLVSIDSLNHTYIFKASIISAYNLKTGDVIVSDAGNGCLRKITEITTSGDNVTITTGFASLTDAVESGSFSFDYHITADKLKSVKLLDRECVVTPIYDRSGKNTNFSWELSATLSEKPKVTITATLSLDPTVSCSYQIKGFHVQKINVEFTVTEQIDIIATLELLNIEWEKEKTLLKMKFAPITVLIGPVPVTIVPTIEIKAGVNLNISSEVTTGVTQTLTYTVGISYDASRSGNKWTNYTELENGFDFNQPQLSATAEAKAYIRPQLDLMIYDVVGPYLFAELYGKIQADLLATPWWSLYAGAGIGAGVKVEIFSYTILDYETDPPPILYEILIASAPGGNNEPPDTPSDPIPADTASDIGINTSLSWTCTDPDNDTLTFDVFFGKTSPPPLIEANVSAFSFLPGTLENSTVYYWRVKAKDGHDHTTAGPVWSFSTESSGSGTGTPCPGTPSITYEGKVYHTTLIGTQCWLKKNLNAGTMVNTSQGQANNSMIEKYCYQNQSANCGLYGGLYLWDELMDYSTTAGAKGICPPGWHVPTDDEWKTMEIALGMTAAEAGQTGWRGTDQGTQLKPGNPTGFDALMSGVYNLGFFSDLNVNGYFATSSLPTASNIWIRELNVDNPKISRYQTLRQNAVSVRCMKD